MKQKGDGRSLDCALTILCGNLCLLTEEDNMQTDDLPFLEPPVGDTLLLSGSVVLRISRALTDPFV